jgi:UDP-GlcNAc:undecaprenyl-phosphate GlcNAc-1-phosphate transferase
MDLSHAETTIGRLLAVGGATAVGSAVLTRAYVALARAKKFAAPADPWHDQPVAQAGGAAVWAVIAIAAVALGLHRDPLIGPALAAGLVLAVVGFVDDRRPLQPNTKLLAQFAIGVALVAVTYRAAPTPIHIAILMPVACLWLVGQSNALNLLDNMDGMCPAIASVSAVGIALIQAENGATAPMTFAIVIAGACFGFLVWNRKPARVFLGDTGSLALGLVLAFLAMQGSWRGEGSSLGRVALPALLLSVPLLNTVFVIVTRHDAGVPVSRGLADHANYRLVAHGFAPNQAVLLLCGLAAACTILALMFPLLPWGVWLCALGLFTLALTYFGIFLSHANVEQMYTRLNVPRSLPPTSLYLTQRRRVFEITSDATLASAAYFLSFQLRFDGSLPEVQEHNLVRGVPVVILATVMAQWVCGLYRVFWKYLGGTEVLAIVKSSCLASAVLYLATRVSLFGNYPRSVYILFAMVFFLLATGYRASLRLMHEWRRGRSERNGTRAVRKVLIVGAGDAGELALRDLRNGEKGKACGFLDDDPEKIGMRIHGVPVLAPTSALVDLASALGVDEVVVAMPSASQDKRRGLTKMCEERRIRVREFQVQAAPPPNRVTPEPWPAQR